MNCMNILSQFAIIQNLNVCDVPFLYRLGVESLEKSFKEEDVTTYITLKDDSLDKGGVLSKTGLKPS